MNKLKVFMINTICILLLWLCLLFLYMLTVAATILPVAYAQIILFISAISLDLFIFSKWSRLIAYIYKREGLTIEHKKINLIIVNNEINPPSSTEQNKIFWGGGFISCDNYII